MTGGSSIAAALGRVVSSLSSALSSLVVKLNVCFGKSAENFALLPVTPLASSSTILYWAWREGRRAADTAKDSIISWNVITRGLIRCDSSSSTVPTVGGLGSKSLSSMAEVLPWYMILVPLNSIRVDVICLVDRVMMPCRVTGCWGISTWTGPMER